MFNCINYLLDSICKRKIVPKNTCTLHSKNFFQKKNTDSSSDEPSISINKPMICGWLIEKRERKKKLKIKVIFIKK